MKFSFRIIENSGPDNLRDTLKDKLAQASEAYFAVAFVTQSGLNEIIQPLREVAVRGKVRFITGLYQCVTEPRALKTLLDIQNETRGRFSVRLSREPQFHRKVYLLENRTKATAIVGSSNLTREGLQSGGELNLMLLLPKTSSSIKELKGVFEKEWKHRAVTLSDEQIRIYSRDWRKTGKSNSYTKSQLERILGTGPTEEPPPVPIRYWCVYVTGIAKKRTRQIISETTNWDKRNYSWFSTGGNHPFRIRDRILLFDLPDNQLQLVEVKDIAHTKIPTPDGRRFVAYQPVPNYGKPLTRRLWGLLANEGIKKKSIYLWRDLTDKKAKHLMTLIKKRRRA